MNKNFLELGEDIPDHSDLPDGDHYCWGHHHLIVFCIKFPKIYITHRVLNGKVAMKNLLELGGQY